MQTGYTGKLPAYGDFVEGGGALRARQAWSAWAERGLSAARAQGQGGNGFADTFLTSPIWRFAVADGVFGETAAAGVFCPSMDKVGRLFPFAAIAELPGGVAPLAAVAGLAEWFERVETLILNALDPEATLETFSAHLADPPALQGGAARPLSQGGGISPLRVDSNGAPVAEDTMSLDLDGDGLEAEAGDGVWITLGGVDTPSRGYTHTGAAQEGLLLVLITGETAHDS